MRVVKTLGKVVFAIIITFAGILLMPRLFGYAPYAVLSGSMEPEYPVGSLIYVTATDPKTIRPGDDVTFLITDGRTATHQAWKNDLERRVIRTQGIANVNADGSVMHDASPVPYDHVIGTPSLCFPMLGYAASIVTTPLGKAILAAVAVASLAPQFIRTDATGTRRRKKASHKQGRQQPSERNQP